MMAILPVHVLHVGQEAPGAQAPVDGAVAREKVYYGHGEGIRYGLQLPRRQDIQCGFREQDTQMQGGENHHGTIGFGQHFTNHFQPLWPPFG